MAQLKADIDAGLTGDKVGGFDPAASPLGTDDEAAGVRLDPMELERARLAQREGRAVSTTANAAAPELAPNGQSPRRSPWLVPSLIGVLAGLAMATFWFVLLGV